MHNIIYANTKNLTYVCLHWYYKKQKFYPKNKKDLGMACHIPPLKKAKKQVEMPLPSLSPIPLKKSRF